MEGWVLEYSISGNPGEGLTEKSRGSCLAFLRKKGNWPFPGGIVTMLLLQGESTVRSAYRCWVYQHALLIEGQFCGTWHGRWSVRTEWGAIFTSSFLCQRLPFYLISNSCLKDLHKGVFSQTRQVCKRGIVDSSHLSALMTQQESGLSIRHYQLESVAAFIIAEVAREALWQTWATCKRVGRPE